MFSVLIACYDSGAAKVQRDSQRTCDIDSFAMT